MTGPLILVLNVGSTSTKVAIYSGSEAVYQEELVFLQPLPLAEQLPIRRSQVLDFLASKEINASELAVIVSRGGLMAYQIAKEIGAMTTVLGSKPDGIVLTGGLSRSVKIGRASCRVRV